MLIMKILLFGHSGLLGHALTEVAGRAGHRLITPAHHECDVTDELQIKKKLAEIRPEIVINTTGYTKVDLAETESEKVFLLNAHAPEIIAHQTAALDIPLIHFSSDYVFDGKSASGYTENTPPSPLSAYGKSKAAGEAAIRKYTKKYYIVRSSWLFGPMRFMGHSPELGPGGGNFVDSILEKAARHEPLRVVNDQTGNPTYTFDLAKAVCALLESKKYGIYHIVNSGDVTWYEFAKMIFEILGVPYQITPINSGELRRAAPRPTYSMLRNTQLPALRSWKDALAEYLFDKQIIL